MLSVCTWMSLYMDSCWIWILRKIPIQSHSILVLVPPIKPPDTVMDHYDGQTYDLKIRMDIWRSMDMVPVEYGIFPQKSHLKMWFFKFITV